MKPLRAHDYPLKAPEQEFRAARRTFALIIAGVLLFAGMCVLTFISDARTQEPHTEAHVKCTCMGRCLRRQPPE
jgi:hypothetical protein